jgi:hypothetical protein
MECADKIAKDDKIFVYQDENSFLIDSDVNVPNSARHFNHR